MRVTSEKDWETGPRPLTVSSHLTTRGHSRPSRGKCGFPAPPSSIKNGSPSCSLTAFLSASTLVLTIHDTPSLTPSPHYMSGGR